MPDHILRDSPARGFLSGGAAATPVTRLKHAAAPNGGNPQAAGPVVRAAALSSVIPAVTPAVTPTPAAMAAAGLRAFERIAQAWGLSVDEQMALLGQPPRSTYFAWRKAPDKAKLSRDTLERLSNLLGIYKSLQMLLPDAAAADSWVRRPNTAPLFGGNTALARMLAGNVADLNLVRRYLDGVRGGGWS
jgi:Protein of unknown function (DUF2384)